MRTERISRDHGSNNLISPVDNSLESPSNQILDYSSSAFYIGYWARASLSVAFQCRSVSSCNDPQFPTSRHAVPPLST